MRRSGATQDLHRKLLISSARCCFSSRNFLSSTTVINSCCGTILSHWFIAGIQRPHPPADQFSQKGALQVYPSRAAISRPALQCASICTHIHLSPTRDRHPVPVRSICVAVQPLLPVQKDFSYHSFIPFPDVQIHQPDRPDDHARVFVPSAGRILVAVLRKCHCNDHDHMQVSPSIVIKPVLCYVPVPRPSGRIQRSRDGLSARDDFCTGWKDAGICSVTVHDQIIILPPTYAAENAFCYQAMHLCLLQGPVKVCARTSMLRTNNQILIHPFFIEWKPSLSEAFNLNKQ